MKISGEHCERFKKLCCEYNATFPKGVWHFSIQNLLAVRYIYIYFPHMNFNQAPSTGTESKEPTLEDKIKAIDDQIEEAHMTFDDALVKKLQAEKAGLESQEKAKQDAVTTQPKTVAEIVKEGDPVELKKLDDRFAVVQPASLVAEPAQEIPSVVGEVPILQDAHVERRNEEIRNKFMEGLKSRAPERAGSFKNISRSVLDLISEDFSFKSEAYKADKVKSITEAITRSADRFDNNCLPNSDYLEKAAKAFGTSVEDLEDKTYQSIKEVLVAENFNPDVFDTLVSSDSAEEKMSKLKKLTSKSSSSNDNY